MVASMRPSTLQTLGLGTVLDILKRGRPPIDADETVTHVFGETENRGALVISGANGIVGAGKTMQLGSRLLPHGVRVVALDLPGAPDGIGRQFQGLVRAFGPGQASRVMENVIRLSYDGKTLPANLEAFRPRFLLEAVPEILEVKKAHYELFRASFPDIEIRSVTSGFPSSELGVGVAHPAFPHEINKVWEIVEPEPSAVTHLLWALGLVPVPVSDHWSFVLDVLFCGVTLASLRYHRATNMPFWKIDKFVRRLLGPNPFRAHDAIGAKGANFLTWSCLHHLSEEYGALFTPTPDLVDHKDSGQNWYPPNHFRPLVDWNLTGDEENEFDAWILGPMCQMASLLLREKRSHFSHINAIGELCAQFRRGILAVARGLGTEGVLDVVERYHRLHPEAAASAWYPDVFGSMATPEWQQLYVNAEHDDGVGVITISRESYNSDVDAELNRAIDWLASRGVENVVVTGDFHLSTQMVGADTTDFFPALENPEEGYRVAYGWSRTARRLHDEFRTSVGFVAGKRCLGGMLELLMHCHYLVAVDNADLGMPEVTLPVVPGMEGCHWPFRKSPREHWPRLVELLLGGRSVKAREAEGWIADFAGPLDECLRTVWRVVTNGDHRLERREVEVTPLADVPVDAAETGVPSAAREAIADTIRRACACNVADAIDVQARSSADFMAGPDCRGGAVGAIFKKTMSV